MPQHAAPRKRMKTDKKRQARNNYVKRTLRTLSKQLQTELPSDDKKALLDKIYSQLDKAAKKGVIHKRTASRRKSRVAALVSKQLKQPE